jgi:hypothetical protein
VGLERGPLSLMRITEELLEWKSSGSGSRKSSLTAVGIRCADHATTSIPKILALSSPICGGRSVSIVRLRTKATEFKMIGSYSVAASDELSSLSECCVTLPLLVPCYFSHGRVLEVARRCVSNGSRYKLMQITRSSLICRTVMLRS